MQHIFLTQHNTNNGGGHLAAPVYNYAFQAMKPGYR